MNTNQKKYVFLQFYKGKEIYYCHEDGMAKVDDYEFWNISNAKEAIDKIQAKEIGGIKATFSIWDDARNCYVPRFTENTSKGFVNTMNSLLNQGYLVNGYLQDSKNENILIVRMI